VEKLSRLSPQDSKSGRLVIKKKRFSRFFAFKVELNIIFPPYSDRPSTFSPEITVQNAYF
jgi:hypothetical protein